MKHLFQSNLSNASLHSRIVERFLPSVNMKVSAEELLFVQQKLKLQSLKSIKVIKTNDLTFGTQ